MQFPNRPASGYPCYDHRCATDRLLCQELYFVRTLAVVVIENVHLTPSMGVHARSSPLQNSVGVPAPQVTQSSDDEHVRPRHSALAAVIVVWGSIFVR